MNRHAFIRTRIHVYAIGFVLIGSLAVIVIPKTVNACSYRVRHIHDVQSLKQIGQTSLIYASDHNDRLPEASDVWDYAQALADAVDLNDAYIWQSPEDPASVSSYDKKLKILLPAKNGRPGEPNPAFLKTKPAFAVPVGRRLSVNHPATTPIAWTRGLQPDGTWAKHSPYGGKGGYIFFLGGNVAFFLNLSDDGGQLTSRDGTKTANILEALPPGCRISEYLPTPAEQITWASEAARQR